MAFNSGLGRKAHASGELSESVFQICGCDVREIRHQQEEVKGILERAEWGSIP